MSLEFLMADWPAPPGVVAFTTTRVGGVSTGPYASLNLGDHVGDEPSAVAENRRRLRQAAGLNEDPRWLRQVHGVGVVDAADHAHEPPEGDAAISTGTAVGILTADCLPVALAADDGSEIAALHCGWRSLAGGIVAATLARLTTPPERLLAWLGPAISQTAFEVGDEVRDAFLAGIENAAACFEPNDAERWQADLYGLARLALAAEGVERVYGGGLCTYRDSERFYSYRRDGECGRLATVVFRRLSP